ncbi:thioesterase superfamily protein [Kribbella flavida DSM 17836]|uniref:Thioesterase superfamily protein n=1 Tax=Kribbella flavida (strain DSM 17836 / JCM 10339 / NBRC 14399) TaxID=479435 RepID=D2Q327_KRIFD|nr:hotdog fold thioesterase [Kribbella flavida]ADB32152.1 thioesterase superfamily protein [Kribbella flavida DSM 17836]
MSDESAAAELPPGMSTENTLLDLMGIVVTEASAERVVATMPVKGNVQPYGLLHGGASCVLAESLGSIGSALHAAAYGKVAVGVDINATHHRAVREGLVTGVATPVYLGRTTTSYEIVVTDERDKRVCTARITCQLIPAPPGS